MKDVFIYKTFHIKCYVVLAEFSLNKYMNVLKIYNLEISINYWESTVATFKLNEIVKISVENFIINRNMKEKDN